MIASVIHNGRKFKVGEFDDGKVAFGACGRFEQKRGWNGCGREFENTEEDRQETLKFKIGTRINLPQTLNRKNRRTSSNV